MSPLHRGQRVLLRTQLQAGPAPCAESVGLWQQGGCPANHRRPAAGRSEVMSLSVGTRGDSLAPEPFTGGEQHRLSLEACVWRHALSVPRPLFFPYKDRFFFTFFSFSPPFFLPQVGTLRPDAHHTEVDSAPSGVLLHLQRKAGC